MEGPNKLLLHHRGGTVVGTVARTLRETGLPIVVVTGRDSKAVAAAVSPSRAVFNPRYAEGLATSIATGVYAIPEDHAALIVLGDMPSLRPEVVARVCMAYQERLEDAIFAPVYSASPERHGHPVLFGPAHRAALLALNGDAGAKSVIDSNLDRFATVGIEGSLADLDSPSDLVP